MSNLIFIEDPGHGWLKVPITQIMELGLLDQISVYSYMDNFHLYLEEDLDLSVYVCKLLEIEGIKRIGVDMTSEDFQDIRYVAFMQGFWRDCTREVYDRTCFVRNLPNYDKKYVKRKYKVKAQQYLF